MRCLTDLQAASLQRVKLAVCPVCGQDVLTESVVNWDGQPAEVLAEHRLDTRPTLHCDGSGMTVQ